VVLARHHEGVLSLGSPRRRCWEVVVVVIQHPALVVARQDDARRVRCDIYLRSHRYGRYHKARYC
jgi:hypothetical protein